MRDDHGSASTYCNYGCRCADCVIAHKAYRNKLRRETARLARIGREVERAAK